MNKKIIMSGVEKDGIYKTPGGVPFMISNAYRTNVFKAMVPHYRVDEFMMEVYGHARLIGIIDDTDDGTKIRLYRVNGSEYKAVYSGSTGFDIEHYYVTDVIDSEGNLLYLGYQSK